MLLDTRHVSLLERMILIIFLDHCYNSLEVDCIREVVQQTLLLSSWVSLHKSLLEDKLKNNEKLRKVKKQLLNYGKCSKNHFLL